MVQWVIELSMVFIAEIKPNSHAIPEELMHESERIAKLLIVWRII